LYRINLINLADKKRYCTGSAQMKHIVLAGLILLSSCATTQKPKVPEDSLMLTRKYVGNFIEYRQHIPEKLGEPYLIWIKTTMDSTLGKITAYGERCDFKQGDRLYIKRIHLSPGPISSYWEYRIESDDNPVTYRLSEYQSDRKNLIKNWF
jgi:hypothetical protein